MKFLFSFLVALPLIGHAQWIFSPTVPAEQNVIRFNSSSAIVYAVGHSVLNSQDSGLSWSEIQWATSKIAIENDTVGYSFIEFPVWPYPYYITKTIDGGKSWEEFYEVYSYVWALGSNGAGTLFMGLSNGTLTKTSNEGQTYQNQFFFGSFLSIDFHDSKHGFVMTSSDLIYQTTDGGNSWTFHYLPEVPRRLLNVTGPNEFWVVGTSNRLFHSVDGGLTVSEVDFFPNDTFEIAGMSFLDSLNGIIVGTKAPDMDKMFYTRDGGLHWQELDLPFQWRPLGCAFMSYNIALITIAKGVFQLDFSRLNEPIPPLKELVLYPNPNSGSFEIEFETYIENLELNLYASDGRLVWSGRYQHVGHVYIDQVLSPGVYHLEINKGWETETQKLVVQPR